MMIMIALLLSTLQSSDKKVQPLASATDTSFLSCTVWAGKEWAKPTERSAQTAVFQSPKGFRAYGEVKVAVNGNNCENTTTLYVFQALGEEFKIVYTKNSSESDGNGIRLIGWSPDGSKLLAEVTTWKYNTDTGYGYTPVIFDVSTDSVKEISTLEKTLRKYFGSKCEFEHSVRSWISEHQIVVKISRTPESDKYGQHFCVDRPVLLVYDFQKDKLQTIQSISKLQSQLAPPAAHQDFPWSPHP
jgi:hypothetical protein